MDDTTVAVIVWGAAVLFLGWTWVPALLSGLGATRYTNGGTEDPSLLQSAAEPEYLFWQRQLVALGYDPVGAAWMRITFYGSDWRYETRVRVFRRGPLRTFAFIQRQPPPLDVWWLTIFATSFQDGSLLLTGNGEDHPPGDGEYVVQGMESMDLAAVHELHLAHAARLQAAGRRPDPDGSLDTLLRATARHAGPAARHAGVKMGQSYLLAHVAIHVVLSLPAAMTMGMAHWAVPFVNLVLGSLLSASEHLAKRRARTIQRAEILERIRPAA